MRQWKQILGVAVLILVVGFFARDPQDGQPHPGETVIPSLESPIQWTPGTTGELGIRLYAHGADSSQTRMLDFSAISWLANPMADITFYCDDEPLSSLEVPLSHRC
jgi:hypothetical protein